MQPIDFEEAVTAARQQLDEALAAASPTPAPGVTIHGSVGAVHTAPVTIHAQTLNFPGVAPDKKPR